MSKNNLEEIIWEGVFQNFEDTQSDTQVFNSDLWVSNQERDKENFECIKI